MAGQYRVIEKVRCLSPSSTRALTADEFHHQGKENALAFSGALLSWADTAHFSSHRYLMMTEQHSLLKKLNFKADMTTQLLNVPTQLSPLFTTLSTASVDAPQQQIHQRQFYLLFVRNQQEIAGLFTGLIPKPELDPVLWFAYPKKSSALYQGDLHRDTGWQLLGQAGFEAVRQVAIDPDWSALRFRHIQHIQSLNRDAKRRLTLNAV